MSATGAWRLLRTRGWVAGLLAVVGFSACCGFLGRWQYGRHLDRVAANTLVDANYAAAPLALTDVLPGPDAALPPSRVWQPVTVTGSYLPGGTVLVRNRPLDGVYGYEVLVPLRTGGGDLLLVDQGWIPNGRNGSAPDRVPPSPDGQVTVTARLRPGEPDLGRAPVPGQAASIDLAGIGAGLPGKGYRAYGVLVAPATRGITPLPRPDEDLGPHLAYAVQWWGFALAAPLLFGRALLVRGRATPVARSGRRRVSDEEWEDALTAG